MALQKANKSMATGFKFLTAGDSIRGYYQGQVTKSINGAPAVEHSYKTKTGVVSVLGQANILNQIKNNSIEPGTYVEIVFSGQVQKLKNGRTMKVYDVSFDRDDTDTTGTELGGDDEDYNTEEDNFSEPETVVTSTTRPTTPAIPPNAERQARVRAQMKERTTQS